MNLDRLQLNPTPELVGVPNTSIDTNDGNEIDRRNFGRFLMIGTAAVGLNLVLGFCDNNPTPDFNPKNSPKNGNSPMRSPKKYNSQVNIPAGS
jgi:hypothetical protein